MSRLVRFYSHYSQSTVFLKAKGMNKDTWGSKISCSCPCVSVFLHIEQVWPERNTCFRPSNTSMYPPPVDWFYLSQTISLQSVEVNCCHPLICWWAGTKGTEINRHLLVFGLVRAVLNTTMMSFVCSFPPASFRSAVPRAGHAHAPLQHRLCL